ncbi:hypothetical protein PMI21_02556 [Pseudomonas sp. GM18]|nr:hypothetical protein PMI21_02556 [Pseudomonas sp. GM18]
MLPSNHIADSSGRMAATIMTVVAKVAISIDNMKLFS